MKIYEKNENGSLDVLNSGSALGLHALSDGVHVTEGNEMYVLVKDCNESDLGGWELMNETPVALYNTHPTGELRWEERWDSSFYRDGGKTGRVRGSAKPEVVLAAVSLGISPTDLSSDEWTSVIASLKVPLDDLSEIEVKMLLQSAADLNGIGKFSDDNTRPEPPRGKALRSLHRDGLALFDLSVSCAGTTVQYFRITKLGLSVVGKTSLGPS